MNILTSPLNDLVNKGLERLQRHLNVGELQRQYRAYGERLVPIYVAGVSMEPVGLRVRDGKVEMVTLHPEIVRTLKRGPPYPEIPWVVEGQQVDGYVVFMTAATFLDVVTQRPLPPRNRPYSVEQVWAESGVRDVRTYSGLQRRRVVFFDGDMAVSAAILQGLMRDYASALKQVLDEMPTLKRAIVALAATQQFFSSDRGDPTFRTGVPA